MTFLKGNYIIDVREAEKLDYITRTVDLTRMSHKKYYRCIKNMLMRKMLRVEYEIIMISMRMGLLGLEILITTTSDCYCKPESPLILTNCQTVEELGIIGILEFALGRKKFLPTEKSVLTEKIVNSSTIYITPK